MTNEPIDCNLHSEDECRSYANSVSYALKALSERQPGSGNELLRLLTAQDAPLADVSVGATVTLAFKRLTDANAMEIAETERLYGKADPDLLRFQAVCRIEFAKFLVRAGVPLTAHEELNNAGDDILKLLEPDGSGQEQDVGLACELGRLKGLVQQMVLSRGQNAPAEDETAEA